MISSRRQNNNLPFDIKTTAIPEHYLITQQSGKIHYKDNFRLSTCSLQATPEPKDCMIAFFRSFSPFFIRMIMTRELIARPLGLKTADKTTRERREQMLDEFEGNIGDKIAIFKVLNKCETELLTGQTDKHLDFKLSFITFKEDEEKVIELATTVTLHNLLGRVYFFFVKPFHKYFMKRILKKMYFVLARVGENEIST